MKKSLLSLLLCLSFCCSGCSATQVKDRLYLQSLELSNYRYPTVQLHAFQSEEADCSGSGSTLSAALESAEIPAGKSLFLGHLELLALQEPEFLQQLPDVMQTYRLSSGCKLLYTTRSLAEVNTETLLESLKQEEQNGRIPETDLLSILKERCNSSGTALLPFRITNGFSMVLIASDGTTQTLSNDAIQGLCWLRGNNYPERVSLSADGQASDFLITSASTRYTAITANGIPIVTVSISIQGSGNAVALRERLETACEAAERETIQQNQADVIELEACLRQQCYKLYQEQDWNSLLRTVQFQHEFTILP